VIPSIDRTQKHFFPSLRSALIAGTAVAALFATSLNLRAQATSSAPQPDPAATQQTTTTPAATTAPDGTVTNAPSQYKRGKKKVDPSDDTAKAVPTKDTKKAIKKDTKADALIGVDAKLPDKQLYDKAMIAVNKGHFDVARLDLQTMLNTYPDSQYQMRAKLAIADSWYKEGGTAALTQAEQEYRDFTIFFPNAPEAAEAQMRIGDIYFRQMDKPDRDYSKAVHAEEEYRRMLTDYPAAPAELTTQAKQRLREVQEVMATRESEIASYYGSKLNYAAEIARLQTVADTYPLYSHMDDTLIGLGDAYESQARYWRNLKVNNNAMAESARAKLEQIYDGMAADEYRKVVIEHAAAPHVEDARDRLQAMNLPVPEPTKDQMAASVALENSRSTYTISNRLKVLILHTPDTVLAAGSGEPLLVDPAKTIAPAVVRSEQQNLHNALAASAPLAAAPAPGASTPGATPASEPAPAPAAAPAAAAPLSFNDVGTADSAPSTPANLTASPMTPSSSSGVNGGGIGIEVVTHPAAEPAPAAAPAVAPPVNNGLPAVGPPNATPLPAVEKAAPAPDRPNEITGPTTPGQTVAPGAKAPKPAFDKKDESSSKHKPKKGIKKLDPLPPL
jgi:outer membrane protein assembly factor BamD